MFVLIFFLLSFILVQTLSQHVLHIYIIRCMFVFVIWCTLHNLIFAAFRLLICLLRFYYVWCAFMVFDVILLHFEFIYVFRSFVLLVYMLISNIIVMNFLKIFVAGWCIYDWWRHYLFWWHGMRIFTLRFQKRALLNLIVIIIQA